MFFWRFNIIPGNQRRGAVSESDGQVNLQLLVSWICNWVVNLMQLTTSMLNKYGSSLQLVTRYIKI